MLKEADLAFKQAFAYCPYSPEAVFRYVQLLAGAGRFQDAAYIVRTAGNLDPLNTQLDELARELQRVAKEQPVLPPGVTSANPASTGAAPVDNATLEAAVRSNPNDIQSAYTLVLNYLRAKQYDPAGVLAEQISTNTASEVTSILFAASILNQLGDFPRAETALKRATQVQPDYPETWFDLAGIQTYQRKQSDAIASLRKCLELNAARLAKDPKATNLVEFVRTDQRFSELWNTKEFRELIGPGK